MENSNNELQYFVIKENGKTKTYENSEKFAVSCNEFKILANITPSKHVTIRINNQNQNAVSVRVIIVHTKNSKVQINRVFSSESTITIESHFSKEFFKLECTITFENFVNGAKMSVDITTH